jgi:hypothetical protein
MTDYDAAFRLLEPEQREREEDDAEREVDEVAERRQQADAAHGTDAFIGHSRWFCGPTIG